MSQTRNLLWDTDHAENTGFLMTLDSVSSVFSVPKSLGSLRLFVSKLFSHMINKDRLLNSLLLITALALAFAAGYLANDLFARYASDTPLLEEAISIFETHALHPLPEQKELEYGMIRGMLEAYGDPNTIFLEPPQHELQSNQLEGTFGGIGVKIERGERGIRLYPFANGPAAEAGILQGDVLLAVDEVWITPEMTNDGIEAALRGPVGQAVRIVIARASAHSDATNGAPSAAQELSFEIRRAEVALPSVVYHPLEREPRAGILQVSIIADTTADEMVSAVQQLQAQGVTHFILDLRENGGGLLNAGINIARLFLQEGEVIEQQYQGKGVERFSVTETGKLSAIPLVVLVNGHTASSAEIVAGALKANGRALLIGEPTFGKNTIQQVFELHDGSSIHITSAHWWFPGLAFPVEGRGLTPDYAGGQTEVEWMELAVHLLFQGP